MSCYSQAIEPLYEYRSILLKTDPDYEVVLN